MKPNNIYLGDCLDLMVGIDDHSIDMILADLPYGTTACAWDSIIPLEPLWAHYKRVIKRNGAIVLTATQPFTSVLINSNLQDYKYQWYWRKERGTGFQLSKYQPLRIIEDICIFGQFATSYTYHANTVTYNPQMIKLDKPYTHVLPRKKIESLRTGIKTTETGENIYHRYDSAYPVNLLDFSRDNGNKTPHPTQKPIALFAYLIRTYTNPGDIVLDNVIGSGTTAIAAIETGRQWIGIEKDEGYYHAAKERIEKRLQQPFLIEPSEIEKPQQLMFGG